MLHQEKKTMIREMIKIIFIGWKNISWVAVEFNVNVTNALKNIEKNYDCDEKKEWKF